MQLKSNTKAFWSNVVNAFLQKKCWKPIFAVGSLPDPLAMGMALYQ